MTRGPDIRQDEQGLWITLSDIEWQLGVQLGFERHRRSVRDGRADRHGLDKTVDGLSLHINGACGEIAYCKWRDCYFRPTVDTFKQPDVGSKVQVKTRSRHDYELIVRSNDKPEEVFVLVTGFAPVFCLRGWLYGHEAMQPEYVKGHGGREAAWFVPHASLRPLPLSPRGSSEIAA